MRHVEFASAVAVLFLFAFAARAEEVKLPAKFVKQCDYYVGHWTTEAEVGGKTYRGTWTVNWSPEKSCLVTHWAAETPDGRACGTRIQGWDALNKRVLIVDFSPNGASSVERYQILSDAVDEGKINGVDAEGKPFKATARTDRKRRDFFTWTVTQDGRATTYKFRREAKRASKGPKGSP